jgi:hypothetical protein
MVQFEQATEPTRAKLRKPTNQLQIMATNTRTNKTANAPEPNGDDAAQIQSANVFDLAAFMATAADAVEAIKASKATKTASKASAERQRCVWGADVDAAASAAGIRLPGLFPKPGSKSAKGAENGWYREPAGAGQKGAPTRVDLARQILWQLVGQHISAGQIIPTAAVLATAAMIRNEFAKSSATPPEWACYLIQPTEPRADGTTVGVQTCILSQLANMANAPVILTTETLRKV